MHDATFWQPLALSQKPAAGGGSVPADVQTFQDAQWGGVRTFAARVEARVPQLGLPSSSAFKQAAVAAIRATSQARTERRFDVSPVGWNELSGRLPSPAGAAARLTHDVRLDLALNAALNDAAVSAWAAKRASEAPRPISIIRYLAFQDQLPLVPGLIKRVRGQQLVLRAGRWVPGAGWAPLAPTPPSPGGVSGDSAFAYAAGEVLTAFTGKSFAGQVARAMRRAPPKAASFRPTPRRAARSARWWGGSSTASSQAPGSSTVAVVAPAASDPDGWNLSGALLILLGGIIYVSGSPSAGTFFSIVGFGLILKYRVLPARRERNK